MELNIKGILVNLIKSNSSKMSKHKETHAKLHHNELYNASHGRRKRHRINTREVRDTGFVIWNLGGKKKRPPYRLCIIKKERGWAVVVHAFNPSTWEAKIGIFFFFSSRPAWSTEWIPGQPGLHREILSQKRNWLIDWLID